MVRLIAPNGATVNVADEYGDRLVESFGYKPAAEKGQPKKAPARKTAAKKSD